MHELYELKDKLCQELEEYANKDMSAGSLDVIDKLAHATKNIGKIIKMQEEDGYSERNYSIEGSYRGRRMGGRSYARGRYSSASEDMVTELNDLMQTAPEHIKGDLRRVIQTLEQM